MVGKPLRRKPTDNHPYTTIRATIKIDKIFSVMCDHMCVGTESWTAASPLSVPVRVRVYEGTGCTLLRAGTLHSPQ